MTNDNQELHLTVTLSALELAELRRRVTYLEAVLTQVLREGERIKEWFSAAELVALRLPGLPTAKNAVTRTARQGHWRLRKVQGRGGERHEYHFSSLPRRAFEALINRVVDAPPADDRPSPVAAPTFAPPPPLPPAATDNTAPPWLLPLVRIIKRQGARSLVEALADLPGQLPAGVQCPEVEEALYALRNIGMIA